MLEVTEIPADDHGQVVDNLHQGLAHYRREHFNQILRIAHGSDVRLLIPELGSDRHPDLAVMLRNAPGRAGPAGPGAGRRGRFPGREARQRDYQEKREEYLALGIGEYWIVDPKTRQVTVLVRQDRPMD